MWLNTTKNRPKLVYFFQYDCLKHMVKLKHQFLVLG